MASTKEYYDFVLDQLSLLDGISSRKMMGEYILYYKGKIFGGIYDDRFLIKKTESSMDLLKNGIEEIPYEGAKPMLLVDEIDNKEFLKNLVEKIYPELPAKKIKSLERQVKPAFFI